MVRNPFRPWWIHVWRNTSFDSFIEAFAAEIAGSGLGMETRILWAARHACKQLRAERDAAIEEGLQVVEALLGEPTPLPDSYYSVAVTVRELRMRLAAAKQENARLRSALDDLLRHCKFGEVIDSSLYRKQVAAEKRARSALAACKETSGESSEDDDA